MDTRKELVLVESDSHRMPCPCLRRSGVVLSPWVQESSRATRSAPPGRSWRSLERHEGRARRAWVGLTRLRTRYNQRGLQIPIDHLPLFQLDVDYAVQCDFSMVCQSSQDCVWCYDDIEIFCATTQRNKS
eukprot:scaffold15478_cov123-Amphora_coffeaeformis.AAC.2